MAANITGTAAKNEYSAAVLRLMPIYMAPSIVAADRDMPGHIARH